MRLPPPLGDAERRGRVGACRRAGAERYGVALAKALAQPPVAAEWCLPLVRRAAPRSSGSATAPISTRLAAASRAARRRRAPELHDGLRRAPEASADAIRLPAPRRASRRSVRWPSDAESRPAGPDGAWPASTRSRTRRAASARRRPPSTSPRASPRPASGARHRPRPAGERDLGARRCARTAPRATTCSTAHRLPSSCTPPPSRTSTSSRRKPDLAGAVVELSRHDDGERYLAQALASGTRPLRLRLPRLPAVARAAHGQRARRGRPRARPGAGGVLRARRPDAADALGRADPAAAQPESRRSAASCSRWSTRRTRLAQRGRGGGAAALRRARLPHLRPALGASRRGAEPRPARDCLRPSLRRSRRLLEGGDGACRARLSPHRNAAASAAASRS